MAEETAPGVSPSTSVDGTEMAEEIAPGAPPLTSIDGTFEYGPHHHAAAAKIISAAREYISFMRMYAKANELVEKILEPSQTKQYGRPVYYYYHSILKTAGWEKPKYLRGLDIVKVAPTYATEQAAIMVQNNWRRRCGWKRLMFQLATVWTVTYDPSTGAEYYFNYLTGEAKWEKPALLRGAELGEWQQKLAEDEARRGEAEAKTEAKAQKAKEREVKKSARNKAKARGAEGSTSDGEGLVVSAGGVEGGEDNGDGNDDTGGDEGDAGDIEAGDDDEFSGSDAGDDEEAGDDPNAEDEDEDGGSDDSDSEDEEVALPREWPRSKVQLILDSVEDEHYKRKARAFQNSRKGGAPKSRWWPVLRSAVFLGGFGRGVKRLTEREWAELQAEDAKLVENKTKEKAAAAAAAAAATGTGEDGGIGEGVPTFFLDLTDVNDDDEEEDGDKPRKNKKKKGGDGDEDADDEGGGSDGQELGALTLAINHLGLKQVSSRMWEMGASLTHLDLSHNAIEHVSEDMAGLTRLRHLDLRHNKIREVPDDWFNSRTCLVEELPDLKVLDLSFNALRELPISIYFNPLLKCLRVSHNHLTHFPYACAGDNETVSQQDYLDLLKAKGAPVLGIGFVHGLLELDASFNRLSALPKTLEECANLQVLRLSDNAITVLPPEAIEGNEELKVLDLGNNAISNLSLEEGSGLASLVNLVELSLRGNPNLGLLPPLSGMGKTLLRLSLDGCAFEDTSELEASLSGLGALTHLSLKGNSLTHLPLHGVSAAAAAAAGAGAAGGGAGGKAKGGKGGGGGAVGFPNLLSLDVSNNQLTELGTALPPKLEHCDLSHNKLAEVPDAQLGLCKRLKVLQCSHNRLGSVPQGVGQLFKLEWLDLSHNNIEAMQGSSVRLLLQLTDLNLSHNQLQEIPGQLSKPPGLRRLNLSHNRLRAFPDVTGPSPASAKQTLTAKQKALGKTAAEQEADLQWSGLEVLDLRHNDLELVPDSLVEHALKLRELYLDHNFLEFLPSSELLAALPGLVKMTAAQNDIAECPPMLLEMLPGLKFIDVSGNPFNGLPAHALVEGCSQGLALQERRDEQNEKELEELEEEAAAAAAAAGEADSSSSSAPSSPPSLLSNQNKDSALLLGLNAGAAGGPGAVKTMHDLAVSRCVSQWVGTVDGLERLARVAGDAGSASQLGDGGAGDQDQEGGGHNCGGGGGGGGSFSAESSFSASVTSVRGSVVAVVAAKQWLNKQRERQRKRERLAKLQPPPRPVADHFGGDVLTLRLGVAHLRLARMLLSRQKAISQSALLRGLVEGSPEWRAQQAKELAKTALREVEAVEGDLRTAEASGPGRVGAGKGRRSEFLKKSASQWPWQGSYAYDGEDGGAGGGGQAKRKRRILVLPTSTHEEQQKQQQKRRSRDDDDSSSGSADGGGVDATAFGVSSVVSSLGAGVEEEGSLALLPSQPQQMSDALGGGVGSGGGELRTGYGAPSNRTPPPFPPRPGSPLHQPRSAAAAAAAATPASLNAAAAAAAAEGSGSVDSGGGGKGVSAVRWQERDLERERGHLGVRTVALRVSVVSAAGLTEKRDKAGSGKGLGGLFSSAVPSKSNPFVVVSSVLETGHPTAPAASAGWRVVHRTSTKANTVNPVWKEEKGVGEGKGEDQRGGGGGGDGESFLLLVPSAAPPHPSSALVPVRQHGDGSGGPGDDPAVVLLEVYSDDDNSGGAGGGAGAEASGGSGLFLGEAKLTRAQLVDIANQDNDNDNNNGDSNRDERNEQAPPLPSAAAATAAAAAAAVGGGDIPFHSAATSTSNNLAAAEAALAKALEEEAAASLSQDEESAEVALGGKGVELTLSLQPKNHQPRQEPEQATVAVQGSLVLRVSFDGRAQKAMAHAVLIQGLREELERTVRQQEPENNEDDADDAGDNEDDEGDEGVGGEALSEGGASRPGSLLTSEVMAMKALKAAQRDQLQKAVNALDLAEERISAAHGKRGNGIEVFYGRACATMQLGHPGAALPDIDKVLSLRKTHLPSLVIRASLREAAGQYRQGRADCVRGLRVASALPAWLPGRREAEEALEASLELVDAGLKECAKAGIDGAKVEREFEVTKTGVALRRRHELSDLNKHGRSLKRTVLEGHTVRKFGAAQARRVEEEQVAKELGTAQRKSASSREYLQKVKRAMLLEREAERRRQDEAREKKKLEGERQRLLDERLQEQRELKLMAGEESEGRALLEAEAQGAHEDTAREEALAKDDEDMDDLLAARSGRRKKR